MPNPNQELDVSPFIAVPINRNKPFDIFRDLQIYINLYEPILVLCFESVERCPTALNDVGHSAKVSEALIG